MTSIMMSDDDVSNLIANDFTAGIVVYIVSVGRMWLLVCGLVNVADLKM